MGEVGSGRLDHQGKEDGGVVGREEELEVETERLKRSNIRGKWNSYP